jgi:arsenite methyltransferase
LDCCPQLQASLDPKLFSALGDENRLMLLCRLAASEQPLTVNALSDCCGVHLSGVSRHLALLREAGVVQAQKTGRSVLYQLRRKQLARHLHQIADALAKPGLPSSSKMSDSKSTPRADSAQTRDQVSRDYAEALRRSQSSKSKGCCGPQAVGPESSVAQLAGYDSAWTEPQAGAAKSSFGCGNPLAFSEVKVGQTVLDLGSGAGLDLLIAAEKVGPTGKVIGVDMTDEMIEAARVHIQQAKASQVEVRKGVIEDLPVDSDSVDWVISNCVINLSTDKPQVFAELARVLRPAGRFSVSDIVAEDLPPEIRQLALFYSACIGGAISEAEYIQGLASAGLEQIKVTERVVYTAEQLEGILSCDFGLSESEAEKLRSTLKRIEGKVWSAKFVGQLGNS